MIAYLAALFPGLGGPVAGPVAVAVAIAAITLINLYSMRASVGTLGRLTVIKLASLSALLLAGAGVGSIRGDIVYPQFSQIETVMLLSSLAIYACDKVVKKEERRNR